MVPNATTDKTAVGGAGTIAMATLLVCMTVILIAHFLAGTQDNGRNAVLAQAMSKLNCCGVATVVLHGNEQLLLIRPIGPVLAMTMLRYQSQIRSPNSVVKVEHEAKASSQELKLAQQLIESSMSTKFDFSQYEDRYTDQLKELINAKIAGRQVIEPPQAEEYTPVINLMDALRKSVQKTKLSHKGKLARDELKSRLAGRGQTKRQQRRKSS